MIRALAPLGVQVPNGFAVTAEAYRYFMTKSQLDNAIRRVLAEGTAVDIESLTERCRKLPDLILAAPLPDDLGAGDRRRLSHALQGVGHEPRSMLRCDRRRRRRILPNASFAGQQESYLNVRGAPSSLDAVRTTFASLFTPRAITLPHDMGFDHDAVALSVGVQKMVRSDCASAGVIFTLDPETGHRGRHPRDLELGPRRERRAGARGCRTSSGPQGDAAGGLRAHRLEEARHEGDAARSTTTRATARSATSPSRASGSRALVADRRGRAARSRGGRPSSRSTTRERRGADAPMDIEWAKDGRDRGALRRAGATGDGAQPAQRHPKLHLVHAEGPARRQSSRGSPSATASCTGRARVIRDPGGIDELPPGEILVTEITDPDWEPIMKMAAGIVTERGGRTSHAAIVARELGIPALVGTATPRPPSCRTGEEVTLSCAEGETGHLRGRAGVRRAGDRPGDAAAAAHDNHAQRGQPGAGHPAAVAPAERWRRARADGVHLRELGRRPPARAHAVRDAAACVAARGRRA